MARKKILRSRELLTMKFNDALEMRRTYETLNEMKKRPGLPEDVKKILAENELLVFEGMNRKENQVKAWVVDFIMTLLQKDEEFRTEAFNTYPHDPQFKMVDGKLTEA